MKTTTANMLAMRPDYLLNRMITHKASNRIYRVVGFSWIADLDEWGVRYFHENEGLEYVRSINSILHVDGITNIARFENVQPPAPVAEHE